jgi:hypothetical protein
VEAGVRRCVIDSAASGLHYLGYSSLARTLFSANHDRRKDTCGMEFFRDCILNSTSKEEKKKFYVVNYTKRKKKEWDILHDSKEYLLCLLGIHSSDGKTDHAVTIVGDWIFDSNCERALRLSKESLDICSSSYCRDSHFVKPTRGYMLKKREVIAQK